MAFWYDNHTTALDDVREVLRNIEERRDKCAAIVKRGREARDVSVTEQRWHAESIDYLNAVAADLRRIERKIEA